MPSFSMYKQQHYRIVELPRRRRPIPKIISVQYNNIVRPPIIAFVQLPRTTTLAQYPCIATEQQNNIDCIYPVSTLPQLVFFLICEFYFKYPIKKIGLPSQLFISVLPFDIISCYLIMMLFTVFPWTCNVHV